MRGRASTSASMIWVVVLSALLAVGAWAGANPVMHPTDSDIAGWISNGIDVAAAEGSPFDCRDIKLWIHCPHSGQTITNTRRLVQTYRFAIILTPQFVSALVGWDAAWNEATWRRLQDERDEVVAELTAEIRRNYPWGHLAFALGIEENQGASGSKSLGLDYCLYAGGRWYGFQIDNCGPLLRFAEVRTRPPVDLPKWAAAYLLRKAVERNDSALWEAELIKVLLTTLDANSGPPSSSLIPQVPSMHYFQPGWARLVLGTTKHFLYFDYDFNNR